MSSFLHPPPPPPARGWHSTAHPAWASSSPAARPGHAATSSHGLRSITPAPASLLPSRLQPQVPALMRPSDAEQPVPPHTAFPCPARAGTPAHSTDQANAALRSAGWKSSPRHVARPAVAPQRQRSLLPAPPPPLEAAAGSGGTPHITAPRAQHPFPRRNRCNCSLGEGLPGILLGGEALGWLWWGEPWDSSRFMLCGGWPEL